MIHKKIPIDALLTLPTTSWEGYVWNSDATVPKQISTTMTVDFKALLTELPFIVEGYLYNAKEKMSITIRHFNGTYYLYKTSNIIIDNDHTQVHQAQEHLFSKEIAGLRFLSVYGEIPDPVSPEIHIHTFLYQTFIGYEQAS